MELPRTRAFGTQGKKPTNDFLSLYGHSAFPHQDPRPPQGMYLKTHDFLQPLERVGKNKNGENLVDTSSEEKPSPPPPPPSIEHVLPGGIGTYSISHISHFNQQVPKPDTPMYIASHTSSTERNGEANGASSNCSSYSGGAFTLWEESLVKEKDTIMNDPASERHAIRELAEKLGQRSSDRPLQTSFSNRNSFSSLASSKQMGQKNKSFLEMMKSAKGLQEDEDDDEEEFVLKKECSSNRGNLTVKVDEKSTDQKANTPRSKHSATEQRRRSKINDRFQVLRELIPHSDQKRDKASFLLEVIEYIQFLQEKVQKYETSYQGWNQETPTKLMPWRNSHGHVESMIDHSRVVKNGPGPGLMLAGKFDESNIAITPIMLANAQTTVEPDLSTGAACKAVDHHSTLNKAVPLPIHLQPNMFSPIVRGSGLAQPPQRPPQEDNLVSMAQPQSQFWQNRACRTEFPIASDNIVNEQEELIIERGTINISSAYSQGLLNSLTEALQSSGLDLSEASISVQIHLGKRAINRPMTTSNLKDQEDPSSSNRAVAQHSRVASGGDNPDQACKRLKTEKS